MTKLSYVCAVFLFLIFILATNSTKIVFVVLFKDIQVCVCTCIYIYLLYIFDTVLNKQVVTFRT